MDEYVKTLAIALANRIVDRLGVQIDHDCSDDIVEELDKWLIDYKLEIKYTGGTLTEDKDTDSHHLFIDGSCIHCKQREKIAAKRCPTWSVVSGRSHES